MSSTAPLVSVVIPTRDRWPMLVEAVRCALAQEDVDVEVIVVDDGGTDGSATRLAERRDSRVQVLRNEVARGAPAARNQAAAVARGEWIAFLDDDDRWAPHKLRTQLALAAGVKDVGFIYGTAVMVDAALRPLRSLPVPEPGTLRRALLHTNGIGGPSSVMVRRAALAQLGGFDERLASLPDWDLWLRLAHSERGMACHEVVVAYVMHETNMTLLQRERAERSVALMRDKHRALSAAEGVRFGELWLSRHLALAERQQGRRVRAACTLAYGAWRARHLGNLPRAVGALLGESWMSAGQRASAGRPETPAWLAGDR